MAAIICICFGIVIGWFAHQYRESLQRIKSAIEKEIK